MRLSRHRRDDAGATLIEFAIVVPLLLLLLFGIVEFGRLISEFTTIRTAAREGARFATTVDSSSGIPNYRDCSEIIDAVFSKVVVGEIDSITVSWDAPGYSHTCTDTDPANDPSQSDVVSGTEVRVSVESTFEAVVPILEIFLDGIALDTEQTREIFVGETTS